MPRIPSIVSDYLYYHAPPGDLIGYWFSAEREYNVVVLYRRNDEYRFSVGAFPEVVGHWGHQLTGGDYDAAEMAQLLRDGFWGADEAMKERMRLLVDRIENHAGIEDMVARCRAIHKPHGASNPPLPVEPRRGPRLTTEAQFRVVSSLVTALADADPAIAAEAAAKLGARGITENGGPLFARDALLKFRKKNRQC